jgi:hypothetical protein
VQPGFLQQTGDPAASHQMALQSLEDLREQQALALAYFDAFLIIAVVAVVLAFLVLLMKRSFGSIYRFSSGVDGPVSVRNEENAFKWQGVIGSVRDHRNCCGSN